MANCEVAGAGELLGPRASVDLNTLFGNRISSNATHINAAEGPTTSTPCICDCENVTKSTPSQSDETAEDYDYSDSEENFTAAQNFEYALLDALAEETRCNWEAIRVLFCIRYRVETYECRLNKIVYPPTRQICHPWKESACLSLKEACLAYRGDIVLDEFEVHQAMRRRRQLGHLSLAPPLEVTCKKTDNSSEPTPLHTCAPQQPSSTTCPPAYKDPSYYVWMCFALTEGLTIAVIACMWLGSLWHRRQAMIQNEPAIWYSELDNSM